MRYLLLICLILSLASSQWSSDPASPQLLGSGVQAQVKTAPDGGVYIAWLTNMGGYHVYLQRFNINGIAQFGDGGMLVSDHDNASWIAVFHMNLDVDSENNAIITVLDERSGPWNVYAYKIAPDGAMLWGEEGLTLSDTNNANYSPRLAILPDNSVVVAWSKDFSVIYFQRISPDGNLLWGDGIIIDDNNAELMSPQPIIDANGDVLIQWISQTGQVWAADSKLHLQKYDLDGNPDWSEPTLAVGPVVFPMGNWLQQFVADSDGGSFSAWTKMSGNVQSSFTQHITSSGSLSWLGGVEFSTNSNAFRMSPRLAISEDSQELMAVWNQSNASQSQRGIYAQRLNENGNRLWGSSGTAVVSLNSNYVYYDLSVANFGEEMITSYIQGNSNNSVSDIYAIRLDADGNHVWIDGEVAVTSSGSSKSDMMVDKGQGCLFVVWTENGNVYAHRLKEDGTLGVPDLSIPGDVNGDGEINVIDIVFTVEIILIGDTFNAAADLNGDGNIDILDIVEIINIILNPQALIQINSGTSYGECWGYCVFELELDNGDAVFTASSWASDWYDEFLDLLLEDNLSQEAWKQLVGFIDFEYFQSLDDVYGCPDCADGGAEFIEIIYDGVAKKVNFEAYTEIDGIQELTILLRDLRANYWDQINENQGCYIIPEVGPCDGICQTYYYNQDTNECEEFIFGCCGPEAFETIQNCIDVCE